MGRGLEPAGRAVQATRPTQAETQFGLRETRPTGKCSTRSEGGKDSHENTWCNLREAGEPQGRKGWWWQMGLKSSAQKGRLGPNVQHARRPGMSSI